MDNEEEKLITNLVQRITGMVVSWSKCKEGEQTQEEAKQEELRNQNVESLLELSATKLNVVAAALCNSFNQLQEKFKDDSEEEQASLAKARVFMMDLLGSCLAFSWAFLKKRFKTVEGSDEKEKIMLKQKEELILPPPLEDPLALKILDICCRFLLTASPPPHMPVELKDKAGRLLFQLSASNFEEPVFSKISANIAWPDETTTPINLVEYLNLNSNRLSSLLVTVMKAVDAGVFKRDNSRLLLARVLTKAIWNWIDHYPMEFVSLCQSSTRLGGEPDKLFDVFVGWSGKNKKGYFWEVQTMLLVLCPDIMLKVALHKDSKSKETADKEKFMNTLNKALKGKLADVSAVCYVDICKASTFVSKTDMSALRYIVPAIETELKERLFNPQVLFKTATGNEVELMTDCLIASFRLSPRKVVNSLFTDFLKPNFPPIFKLVLVNTLQRIVDEGASLPWNPTIQDVYSGMAHQLRALFQDYEQQARNYNELVKQNDRKAKGQLEKLLKDIEILTRLILLFNSDPNLPLFPSSKSAAADLEDTRNLLTGLCSMASLFSQPELSAAASKALLTLHKPEYIARWCTQNVLSGFWDISSAVNICLANVLTDRKDLRITDIHHFISLLKQILVYRNAFLARIHKGHEEENKPVEVGDTNSRALASTQLEVALLIHLGSSETEIVTKVENCFGLLCDEIDIVGASESENSIVTNYGIYKKLASTSVLFTGRAAQQRAIRVELRRIRQTKGNYTAWDQVHQRWTVLTQNILKAYEEDVKKRGPKGSKPLTTAPIVPPEKMVEWNHFSGFLAAAAGVSLGEEMVKVEQTRRDKTETTIKVTDSFLTSLLKLIVSDHDVIRETTTELAGSTLSPAVYSVLFHHLHRKVNKFFGKEGQIKYKPRATTFVDQAISIIKHIMELPPDSHTADDLALLVDFEDLVSHLVKYVSGLVVKDNPAMGLRIKAKMCGCLEAIMQKHQFISFNNEFPFRQSLVEIIMEWISDFSAKPKYKASFEGVSEEKKKEAEKGVQDVDIAAVKAISALLRGLSLPKEEAEEAETSTLKKYFTFFTNLIGRAKSDNPDAQVSQKAEHAIGALSNLLSANIDSALEYFVTMGYHEDLETRAAFLKVLSNILRQGTEFDSLSHEGDKYDKLVELLLEPKLEVVMALCSVIQITEADDVAQLLVRLFEANEKTMDLLKKAIKQEVSKTETENTLFRRNSMATKLLAAYSKMIGTRVLKDILTPVLQNLIANPPSLELDPQKLPSGQDRAKNIENVNRVAGAFLKAITDYVPTTPLPFREICNYMKVQVGKRFPGAEHSAIGGFIMLRFICPAIVAPDGFGLVQSIALSGDLRRGLVLTTKVLQNLANKVMFTKEPHMEEMNTFLKDQMPTIERLFDDLAVIPENGVPVAPLHVPEEQREEDLANLHYHLSNSLDKLHKILSAEGKKGKKRTSNVFLRLTAILSQLGPAPEPSRNTQFGPRDVSSKKAGGGTNNLHAGFMDEHAKLDTSALEAKKVFFKHGMTKDKQAVFYYIARKLEKSFTQDQLIFHIMKTLQPELGKPFVVVIDCTLFSKEFEITPAWISRFRQVAPSFENLVNLFFINANYEFKKYSKKIAKLVSRARSKMVFLSSLKELFQYIPEKDIGLPASTLAVEKDVKASFSPVQKLMPYNNQKEVIVRISNNLFAVVTVKQHNIFGKRVPLVDLFHISSIFEINISVDTNEFVIKYDKDASKSMTFRTPASEQIILALKASKARWNLSKTEEVAKRSFRAADVPGTLLNMALLNLGNPSAVLRVEAYNLLAALCSSFNLSVQTSLWETSGLCIPKNTNNFIVSLSKRLATNNSNMTLEFLMEAVHGIEKIKANLPGKQLSLNYITHWLPNLRLFCLPSNKPDYPANVEKTKEIVHLLIEFTIRETSMTGPAIQSQVWEVIGAVPEILDLVIDCLLERANDKKTGGISSTASGVIGDIFVSMASQNPRLVSGKIIAGLMKVLAQTHEIKGRLEDHPKWKEIETLVRILLMLSFENLLYVSQYLPELFHIVLLLFATGPPLVRATVHGLLINIVHSLYTTMVSSQNKMQSLRLLLSELDQQKTRVVFGLGGLSISAFSKPSEKAMSLEAAPMAIGTVETVAMSLLSILNYCSSTGSCLGTAWHSRFLSLATRVAYTPNTSLQPRAIIALGVLCNSSSLVTDDLMSQVLRTLLDVLVAGHNLDQDLPLSLIICLTRLFEHLPSRSKYFKPMFWLAMVLLEIDEPSLFAVAIGLLEVVLKSLDNHDCFADGIISYCMAAREECGLEEALSKSDQVTGINFKTSFSFAVAGHLLKGLRKPATKTATARVLSTFVDIAAKKSIGNNMLGYLAALLPIKGDDMENMRQLLSGEAGSPHQYLFREEMLPDTMNGALLFTLLVTILKSSDSEHEQQFIYESLKEGVLAMPEAFPVVYDVLIPKMTYVIQNSQNPQIIDACLCIMKSMFSGEMEATTSKKRLNKDYLSTKIGFQGLIDCDTFAKSTSAKTAQMLVKIACQLLEQILKLK